MPYAKDEKVIVYLVDDDELHLKILKSKFETSTNYKIHAFTSAEDFLKDITVAQIPKRHVVVVILDFFLKTDQNPNAKDGIEVLKTIKELDPEIEVVMLSGLEDVDIATSAMHYGAVTFVKKNENSFSRIHNNIKWIISEKHLKNRRDDSRSTTKIFVTVLVIIVVAIIIIKLFFPDLI